jgi:hypothetical protein
MDATLEHAIRMIAKMLKAEVNFFHEYHYLNPLVGSSGFIVKNLIIVVCSLSFCECESFSYSDVIIGILYSGRYVVVYCAFTAIFMVLSAYFPHRIVDIVYL